MVKYWGHVASNDRGKRRSYSRWWPARRKGLRVERWMLAQALEDKKVTIGWFVHHPKTTSPTFTTGNMQKVSFVKIDDR